MHIDTHCHIDLFNDPIAIIRAYERANTGCVLTTMLPSHCQAALQHLKSYKTILPALGMHPLRAKEGKNEISLFKELVSSVECIGEIGLDLSSEGQKTKEIQFDNLRRILPVIGSGKFVTIHSRNAHDDLSNLLDEYNVGPVCFHYFVGGPEAAEKLASKGHFFSINNRMLLGKHRSIVEVIPRERLLVESDGPFLTKNPLSNVEHVYDELSKTWQLNKFETDELLAMNFRKCRTIIK